jgi:glycosyltransferase involved in cell wall biosynthesis
VSVIIPCYHSHTTLDTCLESLRTQSFRDFEVLVVDSTPDDDRCVPVASVYPFVKTLRSPHRLSAHAARNEGARLARGSLLVFTDPDMQADPAWLERLVVQHTQPGRLVGGGVASLPGYWNHAVHLTKYGWWLAGGTPRRRPQLPSGNMSVSRGDFMRASGFPPDFWAGDSELSWTLRAAGLEVWIEPRAILTHLHSPSPRSFATERLLRGRDFGRARVRRDHWTRFRCAAYLALAPAVPLLMACKTGWFASQGHHLLWWIVTLPVQCAGYAAWAAGEATAHFQALRRGERPREAGADRAQHDGRASRRQ